MEGKQGTLHSLRRKSGLLRGRDHREQPDVGLERQPGGELGRAPLALLGQHDFLLENGIASSLRRHSVLQT